MEGKHWFRSYSITGIQMQALSCPETCLTEKPVDNKGYG